MPNPAGTSSPLGVHLTARLTNPAAPSNMKASPSVLSMEDSLMRAIMHAVAPFLITLTACAATITVDGAGSGDYSNIGDALGAATSGDTILVFPGTYSGPENLALNFAGRSLVLISQSGAAHTTIACQEDYRAFLFDDGEDTLAVVDGFKITGGHSAHENGGAVLIANSSYPAIRNCRFVSCRAYGNGGAIAVETGGVLTDNCEFLGCYSFGGGAIYCSNGSAVIRSCQLSSNEAYGKGCALRAVSSSVSVRTSVFYDNTGWNIGSACVHLNQSTGLFAGCVFDRNGDGHETGYHGVVHLNGSSPTFEDCEFVRNFNTHGVVEGLNSSPLFERCVFADNYSWGSLAGFCTVAVFTGAGVGTTTFRNCTFQGRMYYYEGAEMFVFDDCSPLIENCVIAFSSVPGVVAITGGADPTFRHCVMYEIEGADTLCGPGSENLLVDPLWCGIWNHDYTLCSNSPCLPGGNGWGELVGARGEGCGECDTPVGSTSWGAIKAMYR